MADAELVSRAAAALGVPEPIVQRSAAARAAANGVDVDEVLEAWAGGGAVATGTPSGTAPETEEPAVAAEEETEDGGRKTEAEPGAPKVETPATVAAVAPAPAAAAAATAVVERPRVIPVLEGRRESHWKLIAGVVGLLTLGLLGGWILPTIDTLDDPGAPAALTAAGEEGRRIYLREGCQTCHTQVVRAIVTDAGLGPVSSAGSVGGFPGDTIGSVRYGPDLTHYGSREGVDLATVMAYLRNPQGVRPNSLMPPIDYLDDAELEALAQFLVESK
ncbi:MAG TPA: cbb3-type cytochrome c oxidase subunit II [Acidimicrobiia bacterium]|nr:cbb3-type cytochrome c oxidase subunit II [Acidimicrobiia bacterium]